MILASILKVSIWAEKQPLPVAAEKEGTQGEAQDLDKVSGVPDLIQRLFPGSSCI